MFKKKIEQERPDTRVVFKEHYQHTFKGTEYRKQQTVSGKFQNVLFDGCKFSHITFKNCEFENVFFYNCSFWMCNFEGFRPSYQKFLVFSKSSLTQCKFINMRLLTMTVIDGCIMNTTFDNVNLYGSQFVATAFKQVRFKNKGSLSNVEIIRPLGWLDIEFDNTNGNTEFNRKTFLSKFDYDSYAYGGTKEFPMFKDEVMDTSSPTFITYKSENVGNTFLNFAHQFNLNNLQEQYGEYYFRGKREIHKKLPAFKKFKSFIGWITCGYGERWYYGLITSLITIFASAFIYLFNGLTIGSEKVINYDFDFSAEGISFTLDKLYDFGNSLYFSMMTFTTVGYGNIQAKGEVSHILSFVQMYFGVVLIAIITGSILRKLFR